MKRVHLWARDFRDSFTKRRRAVGVCGQYTTTHKATHDRRAVTCKDCIKEAGIVIKCSYKTCDNEATSKRLVNIDGRTKLVHTCDACAVRLQEAIDRAAAARESRNAE